MIPKETTITRGEHRTSIRVTRQAGGDRKVNAQQWLDEGTEMFKQGRYEECIERMCWVVQAEKAARAFFRAVEIQPDSYRAHYNLGAAYEALGSYMEAEREYQEALRLNPEYSNARNGLRRLQKLHRDSYSESPWDQPNPPRISLQELGG